MTLIRTAASNQAQEKLGFTAFCFISLQPRGTKTNLKTNEEYVEIRRQRCTITLNAICLET